MNKGEMLEKKIEASLNKIEENLQKIKKLEDVIGNIDDKGEVE